MDCWTERWSTLMTLIMLCKEYVIAYSGFYARSAADKTIGPDSYLRS
jgi:hypothetical protein